MSYADIVMALFAVPVQF